MNDSSLRVSSTHYVTSFLWAFHILRNKVTRDVSLSWNTFEIRIDAMNSNPYLLPYCSKSAIFFYLLNVSHSVSMNNSRSINSGIEFSCSLRCLYDINCVRKHMWLIRKFLIRHFSVRKTRRFYRNGLVALRDNYRDVNIYYKLHI